MIDLNRKKYSSWATLVACAAMLSVTAAANADIALTYTVNVTGLPPFMTQPRPGFTPPAFPETVKVWYSGSKARVEQVGGSVTIYDTAAGEEYHLNPTAKTYFIQDANGAGRGSGGPGGRPGGFGGDSTADLAKTGDTKTILSNPSTRYALSGSLMFGRRGGGAPGGGGPGGPQGGGGFVPPTVSGDVWFSSAVPLPDSATSAAPEASILSLGMRPLQRPMSEAVLKIKEIPLAGKVSLSMTRPSFNGGDPTTINIVETFSATDVHSGTFSSDLFTPPASYTKVDPPQRGFGGGFGGRRRGGGGFGGGYGGGGGGQDNGGGAPPPDDNGGGMAPPPPDDNGGGAPPPPDDNGGGNQ